MMRKSAKADHGYRRKDRSYHDTTKDMSAKVDAVRHVGSHGSYRYHICSSCQLGNQADTPGSTGVA